MKERKKISGYYPLDVELHNKVHEEVKSHLERMVLGTPGKMEYRYNNLGEKLLFLKDFRFLVLKKSGRIIGTICFVRRKPHIPGVNYSCWYIRYFYIRAPLRPKKYQQRKKPTDSVQGMNIIWKSVEKYFDQPDIMVSESERNERSLLYGFIPEFNIRSANFSDQIDILPVRKLRTYFFSRFRPSMDRRVEQISEKEKVTVRAILEEFYKDHILYTDQNLFYKNQYYVLKSGGEVLAGIQANPESWELLGMSGLKGFLLLNLLPVIPFVSRCWNPKNFRFTAVEGIFFKEGHEDKLIPLLESVCAIHTNHFIFSWIDPDGIINQILKKSGKNGFLSRLFPVITFDLRIKFINWKKNEINYFIKKPAYISCFDIT